MQSFLYVLHLFFPEFNLKCTSFAQNRQLQFYCNAVSIGGQYRGTFLVPVPSVLLWYRYRGTLLFFGGTGTLVLFYFLVGILRT